MKLAMTILKQQALAHWKLFLSFRKGDWVLNDYPVITRRQKIDSTSRETTRWKLVPYSAMIVNWGALSGSGDTAAEAIGDLGKKFAAVKAERLQKQIAMPRPGTHVQTEFADAGRVNTHPELAADFIRRVLGLDWAWISDQSSLWDFHGDDTNDALLAKIKEIYGVDVSDLESALLCDIFDRIAASQNIRY